MKKSLIFVFSTIYLIIALSCPSYSQKKEIVWLTADFPPYEILSGPFKGKGNIGYMKKKVIESLNEYVHINMVANSKRIFHELKNQDMVSYASALKSKEREKHAIFSVPFLIARPNHVLVRKSKFDKFRPYIRNGHLQLDRLITESDLLLGRSVGRSYGRVIDKILKKQNGHKNIWIFYDDLFKRSIIELIKKNVDYIIGYPSEASYFLKITNKEDYIVPIPVEGTRRYHLGYFAFSKTPWGKSIVKRVNTVLKKHRNSVKFHKNLEFWLDSKGKKRYRSYVKEFYSDK